MGFEFRLKTGFFETQASDLLISKGKLVLSPAETEGQIIMISEKDIFSIILKNMKLLEFEIHTWDRIYQGILSNKGDYESLLAELKENISKKIVCEYEGG